MTPLVIMALILAALVIIRLLLHFVMPDLRMGIGVIIIIAVLVLIVVVIYFLRNGSTIAEIFAW